MEQQFNPWHVSRENVLKQENHFLVDKEIWRRNQKDLPPIHNHIFTEIELISSGQCIQNINGHTMFCTTGTLFLMFPQDVHQYESFDENTLVYSLCFADDMLPRPVLDILYSKNGVLKVDLSGEALLGIQDCFEKLIEENKAPKLLGNLMIKRYILEIVVEILRRAKVVNVSIKNPALREALAYIRENFRQPLNLDDMARTVHLSPQYFSKLFKTELNLNFHQYVRNMRLDYAMMLLSTTTMGITEACLESGFNSSSNFTKIFKERFGVLPKDVRQK